MTPSVPAWHATREPRLPPFPLLSAGASVNATNDDGATPLSLAKEGKVVALLRRHGGRT